MHGTGREQVCRDKRLARGLINDRERYLSWEGRLPGQWAGCGGFVAARSFDKRAEPSEIKTRPLGEAKCQDEEEAKEEAEEAAGLVERGSPKELEETNALFNYAH